MGGVPIETEEKRLLKEKKAQLLYELKKRRAFEEKNKILFFNDPNKGYLGENGTWEYNAIQGEFFEALGNSKYMIFTLTGANRISKTFTAFVSCLTAIRGKFPWEDDSVKPWLWEARGWRPPIKIRILGQDWEQHIKTVLIKKMNELAPVMWGFEKRKNNVGVEAKWFYPANGSTIEVMSNKSESDLFEGWDGHVVYYDEPPKRDNRVACARGLIDHNGIEIFAMTLLKEAWVDREVIKATINNPGHPDHGKPDLSVFNIHGDISVNIGHGITRKGVDQFKKTLTEDEIQARINGVPSYMSGLVYPQFKRDIHLKPRFRNGVPLDWPIDILIDFHPKKPWAVLFLATDPRGYKWVVDEIWEHGSWKAIGEMIIRTVKRNNYRVNIIAIDPLSKGDTQSDLNEESVYEKMLSLFMSYGYTLRTACKDKDGGIIMVKDLLMTENEMPALFFFDDLKRTVYEIEGYMYDDNGKPLKEDDDMMENLYRAVLLDTKYTEIEDEDDYEPIYDTGRSTITGY